MKIIHREIYTDQESFAKTNSPKYILVGFDVWGQQGMDSFFHLKKVLCIIVLYFSQKKQW